MPVTMMSSAGTPQCCRYSGPFVRRGEVVVARLIDPQAMRFEIGRRRDLRRSELFLSSADDAMISAGRKCVLTITSHGSYFKNRRELAQVELFSDEPQPIGFLPGSVRAIHQVVEVAEHVRRLVDEIEIRLAVNPAKGGVGQLENIDIFDDGLGIKLPQRKFAPLAARMCPAPTEAESTNTRLGIDSTSRSTRRAPCSFIATIRERVEESN